MRSPLVAADVAVRCGRRGRGGPEVSRPVEPEWTLAGSGRPRRQGAVQTEGTPGTDRASLPLTGRYGDDRPVAHLASSLRRIRAQTTSSTSPATAAQATAAHGAATPTSFSWKNSWSHARPAPRRSSPPWSAPAAPATRCTAGDDGQGPQRGQEECEGRRRGLGVQVVVVHGPGDQVGDRGRGGRQRAGRDREPEDAADEVGPGTLLVGGERDEERGMPMVSEPTRVMWRGRNG